MIAAIVKDEYQGNVQHHDRRHIYSIRQNKLMVSIAT